MSRKEGTNFFFCKAKKKSINPYILSHVTINSNFLFLEFLACDYLNQLKMTTMFNKNVTTLMFRLFIRQSCTIKRSIHYNHFKNDLSLKKVLIIIRKIALFL